MITTKELAEIAQENRPHIIETNKNRKKLQDRLDKTTKYITEVDGTDPTANAMRDLLLMCQDCDQVDIPSPDEDFYEVSKVCQLSYLGLTVEELRKLFKELRFVNVPNVGLYVVLEGLLTPKTYRESCGFSQWENDKNYKDIRLTSVPEGYRTDLCIPAYDGLFIPKDTPFVKNIDRRYQITFFDAR